MVDPSNIFRLSTAGGCGRDVAVVGADGLAERLLAFA